MDRNDPGGDAHERASTPTARPRSLRNGSPLWAAAKYGRSIPSTPLTREVRTDVVVIGTGISGALVAHALVSAGHRVVMLDRRVPSSGSTLASTALLQFEIDLPLHKLAESIGYADARRAWRRSLAAVQTLRTLVRRLRIRCAWSERDSLYLSGDAYGARALRHEAALRERAGIPGAFLSGRTVQERFDIERTGALWSGGSACANPAQLTAGILRRAVARGARIHTHADVQHLSANRRGVTLDLACGLSVHAQHVVCCTGYELLPAIPRTGASIASTWAIATEPVAGLPAWLRSTLLWEASDPYLYVRTTPDGRVIAGGEDEDSASRHADLALLRAKSERIVRNVEALLPDIALRVAYRWAGAFGASPTGLPIIDCVPGMRHCYALAGFGGNGITHSVIGAEVIARAIAGSPDPDARLFAARR